MDKTILVYLDKTPVLNLEVKKTTTIKEIKKTLEQYYPNYSIRLFLNKEQELKVFHINKCDNLTLESVYEQFEDPYILLYRKIGKIRLGQQQRAKPYPSYDKYEIIPAWSRGAGEWKQLSPFYIKFPEKEIIFENFWQSFKVFKQVDKQSSKNWKYPEETHVDDKGEPNEKWFKWHEKLLHHDLPVRRPNGRNIPLYAYWNGEKLDTVEARRKIYIPYLQQLYRANPVYHKLLEKVKSGKNIMIVEPDGPLLESYPKGLEVTLDLLESLISRMNYGPEGFPNKYRPFGHGAVIAMTILEDLN